MPAVAVVAALNAVLAEPGSGLYESASQACLGAETVRRAVRDFGILNRLAEPLDPNGVDIAAEARALLRALPSAVDQALLSALRSGFARELPIRLRWVEGDALAVRVSETNGWVRIVLETPDGREFT